MEEASRHHSERSRALEGEEARKGEASEREKEGERQ